MNTQKVECTTCGEWNDPSDLDCTRCHAPLSTADLKSHDGPRSKEAPRETPSDREWCDCPRPDPMPTKRCAECGGRLSVPAAGAQGDEPRDSEPPLDVGGRLRAISLRVDDVDVVATLPCVLGRISGSVPRQLAAHLESQFPGVSERHLVFFSIDEGVGVMDLGATNGSWIDTGSGWARLSPDTLTMLSLPGKLRLGQKCLLTVSSSNSLEVP